jgi:hypothetical protein
MGKLLLNPTKASTALGIGRSKVNEPSRRSVRSVHIGACLRVPAEALHAFLERLGAAG